MSDQAVFKACAELAKMLDDPAFMLNTTPKQRIGYREAADDLIATFEKKGVDFTPAVVFVFYCGAVTQASCGQDTPMAHLAAMLELIAPTPTKKAPNVHLTIAVAYMARDILAGERVE